MGNFDFVTTKAEKQRKRRESWQRIKRGARGKKFENRLEAAQTVTAARKSHEQLDLDWNAQFLPWWNRARSFVLRRDKFQCQACSKPHKKQSSLHVHHIVPRRWPGSDESAINLIALCSRCHKEVDLALYWDIGSDKATAMPPNELKRLCYAILARVIETKRT